MPVRGGAHSCVGAIGRRLDGSRGCETAIRGGQPRCAPAARWATVVQKALRPWRTASRQGRPLRSRRAPALTTSPWSSQPDHREGHRSKRRGFCTHGTNKALADPTASDIRDAYEAAAKKFPRRPTYAMQVLRAPCCGGTASPLPAIPWVETAGAIASPSLRLGEIRHHPARVARSPVACSRRRAVTGRLRLLPVPIADGLPGNRDPWSQAARLSTDPRGDVDLRAGRVIPAETPRTGATTSCCFPRRHSEIAKRNCRDAERRTRCSRSSMRVRKTLAGSTRAGTSVQGHGLRATFASIAEEPVSPRCSNE